EVYSRSLHDALPILARERHRTSSFFGKIDREVLEARTSGEAAPSQGGKTGGVPPRCPTRALHGRALSALGRRERGKLTASLIGRSEEHTSELQSREK